MSTTSTLADLCDLVSEQVDPTGIDPALPYLGLEHLAPGRLTAMMHGRAGDVQSHKFAFRRGDVLYGKLRPYLDKAVLAEHDGVCTTELLVLRPKSGVDRRYLACVVHAPGMVEHAMTGVTGAHHPRTSWSHISQFGVPPLEEPQQKLVATLQWQLHTAIDACAQGEAVATRLKNAATRQIFTRGLRGQPQKETAIGLIPETWDVVRLGSLGRIGNGSTPKKSVREYWEGGTFPWLNSAKVYDRDIVAAEAHVTPLALKECHLPVLKPGAVLVAITGQGKTLGHCAVLRMEATINQHLAYLQPDLHQTNPRYVAGYLETQYENLRQVASGGGSTKGALTCAYLRDLQIPMPPTKDEQDEIAEVIDAIDRKVDLHRRKRAVLEGLFKSLLHRLMTGEMRVADLDLSALSALAPMPQEAHS